MLDVESAPSVEQVLTQLRTKLNGVLLGKEDRIELVLACLISGGHLLLDDLPGLGKTTLAKAIASSFGARFARVQCTPDLLPTDIIGFQLFNQKVREFEFHPGPVFSDILLADELNRTTPRTQSALFEAMAERQVTVDGKSSKLSSTFFVIATQNPIDSHGAYPLPEAQLDRFSMKLEIGYPSTESQLAILSQDRSSGEPSEADEKASELPLEALTALQQKASSLHIDEAVQRYIIALCEATRSHESVALGVSPRGMLIWQQVSKSWALLQGRDFVTPADVQAVAHPVLGVRVVARQFDPETLINSILENVEVPTYQ
ncbi:MAG: MoxR family ATPase [Planctomycetota bacterium]|nr:MoxR family ATPase [Planctomycetota bacterium]